MRTTIIGRELVGGGGGWQPSGSGPNLQFPRQKMSIFCNVDFPRNMDHRYLEYGREAN